MRWIEPLPFCQDRFAFEWIRRVFEPTLANDCNELMVGERTYITTCCDKVHMPKLPGKVSRKPDQWSEVSLVFGLEKDDAAFLNECVMAMKCMGL